MLRNWPTPGQISTLEAVITCGRFITVRLLGTKSIDSLYFASGMERTVLLAMSCSHPINHVLSPIEHCGMSEVNIHKDCSLPDILTLEFAFAESLIYFWWIFPLAQGHLSNVYLSLFISRDIRNWHYVWKKDRNPFSKTRSDNTPVEMLHGNCLQDITQFHLKSLNDWFLERNIVLVMLHIRRRSKRPKIICFSTAKMFAISFHIRLIRTRQRANRFEWMEQFIHEIHTGEPLQHFICRQFNVVFLGNKKKKTKKQQKLNQNDILYKVVPFKK